MRCRGAAQGRLGMNPAFLKIYVGDSFERRYCGAYEFPDRGMAHRLKQEGESIGSRLRSPLKFTFEVSDQADEPILPWLSIKVTQRAVSGAAAGE